MLPPDVANGELNGGDGDGGTFVDIGVLKLVESLNGEAARNP